MLSTVGSQCKTQDLIRVSERAIKYTVPGKRRPGRFRPAHPARPDQHGGRRPAPDASRTAPRRKWTSTRTEIPVCWNPSATGTRPCKCINQDVRPGFMDFYQMQETRPDPNARREAVHAGASMRSASSCLSVASSASSSSAINDVSEKPLAHLTRSFNRRQRSPSYCLIGSFGNDPVPQ